MCLVKTGQKQQVFTVTASTIRVTLLTQLPDFAVVPGKGLEPPRLSAADFESAASTDSATPARGEARIIPEASSRIKPTFKLAANIASRIATH
jgi:hypothetical protein